MLTSRCCSGASSRGVTERIKRGAVFSDFLRGSPRMQSETFRKARRIIPVSQRLTPKKGSRHRTEAITRCGRDVLKRMRRRRSERRCQPSGLSSPGAPRWRAGIVSIIGALAFAAQHGRRGGDCRPDETAYDVGLQNCHGTSVLNGNNKIWQIEDRLDFTFWGRRSREGQPHRVACVRVGPTAELLEASAIFAETGLDGRYRSGLILDPTGRFAFRGIGARPGSLRPNRSNDPPTAFGGEVECVEIRTLSCETRASHRVSSIAPDLTTCSSRFRGGPTCREARGLRPHRLWRTNGLQNKQHGRLIAEYLATAYRGRRCSFHWQIAGRGLDRPAPEVAIAHRRQEDDIAPLVRRMRSSRPACVRVRGERENGTV